MDQITKSLTLIGKAVKENNKDVITKLINKFTITCLPLETSNKLFSLLLKIVDENSQNSIDNYSITCLIYKLWIEDNPTEDDYSFYSQMYTYSIYSIKNLKQLKDAFENSTENNELPRYNYVDVMLDLLQLPSSPEIYSACEKLVKVYGEQSLDVYKIVYEETEEKLNTMIGKFLLEKIRSNNDYAEKPEWIKDFLHLSKLPNEEVIQTIINQNPILDKLGEQLTNFDDINLLDTKLLQLLLIGIEETKLVPEEYNNSIEKLKNFINSMTTEEKILLYRETWNSIENNTTSKNLLWLRLLGPSNPINKDSITAEENNPAENHMFTCHINDYNDETEEYDDWFSGYCWFCDLKIKKYCYAVRMPVPDLGGWKGCYCSWDCVRKASRKLYAGEKIIDVDIEKAVENEGIANDEGIVRKANEDPVDEDIYDEEKEKLKEDNSTLDCFIDYFENSIKKIGIQDRQ